MNSHGAFSSHFHSLFFSSNSKIKNIEQEKMYHVSIKTENKAVNKYYHYVKSKMIVYTGNGILSKFKY